MQVPQRSSFLISLLINVILLTGCGLTDYFGRAEVALKEIETQMAQLPPYPDSTRIRSFRHLDLAESSLGFEYVSDASREQVYEHYESELTDRGWTKIQEGKFYDWGEDVGNYCYLFQNDDFHLYLLFYGDREMYGRDYSISMEWASGNKCPGEP